MKNYFTFFLLFVNFQLLGQFDNPQFLLGSDGELSREFFDFDNDGRVDMVSGRTDYLHPTRGVIQLNRQSAEGSLNSFEVITIHLWPDAATTRVKAFDFDSDGYSDIAVFGTMGLALYRNLNGGGLELMFESYVANGIPVGYFNGEYLSIEDFNGDGYWDLCTTVNGHFCVIHGTAEIWGFEAIQTIALDGWGSLVDTNFDGHIDIIGSNAQSEPTVFMNYGNGGFNQESSIFSSIADIPGQLMDVNGDDLLDLVSYSLQSIDVLINQGDGDFETVNIVELNNEDYISTMGACDIDQDGTIEIIYLYSIGFEDEFAMVAHYDQGQFISVENQFPLNFLTNVFFDHNGDGLMDMVVPEENNFSHNSGVYLRQGQSWVWKCYLAEGVSLVDESEYEFRNPKMTYESNIIYVDHLEDGLAKRLHYESFADSYLRWSSEFRDLNGDLKLDFLFIVDNPDGTQILNVAFDNGMSWDISQLMTGNSIMMANNVTINPFVDFNQDGWMDFACSLDGQIKVYLNNGEQGFALFDPGILTFSEIYIANEQRIFFGGIDQEFYSFDELLPDGTWTNFTFSSPISEGESCFLGLQDYDMDGELDLFFYNDNRAGLISNALQEPVLVWDELGDGWLYHLTSPVLMHGSWKHVATYLYDQPIIEIATGTVWFEFDQDLSGHVIEPMDIDNDGDLDIVCNDPYGDNVFWYPSQENESSLIDAVVFHDTNQNGEYDGTESLVNIGIVECSSASPFWMSTHMNGSTSFNVMGDVVILTHYVNNELWQHTGNNQVTVWVEDVNETVYFGIYPIGAEPQCTSSLSLTNGTCNVESILILQVTNSGNVASVCGASVQIHSLFDFISASSNPSVDGNNYTFDLGILEVGQSAQIQIHLSNPSEQNIGSEYAFVSTPTTTYEGVLANHEMETFNGIVTCAYDPNDKTELSTLFTDNIYTSGQELKFLVRFQNTGNAPATNIHIVDQLSNVLDLSTFQMLGASHDYYYSLSSSGELIVYFDNIMLPDSFNNEPFSHGFFQYSIHPYPTATPQTVLNTAYIYFDENPPVITNTTVNQWGTIAVEETGLPNAFVNVYPNPNHGRFNVQTSSYGDWTLDIIDLQGKRIAQERFIGDFHQVQTALPVGLYIARISERTSGESLNVRIMCAHQ